jgi:hypothetical protein
MTVTSVVNSLDNKNIQRILNMSQCNKEKIDKQLVNWYILKKRHFIIGLYWLFYVDIRQYSCKRHQQINKEVMLLI